MDLETIELIRTRPWRDLEPQSVFERSRMSLLTMNERKMLYWLTRESFHGAGTVVDLGAFLGSSTLALAAGLHAGGHTSGQVHAYDLFEVSRDLETQAFLGRQEGDSFLDIFEETIEPFSDRVTVHAGDLREHGWPGDPIELLFVDLAKSWEMNELVIRTFYRHLIPGRSILIHQDFGNSWNPWLPVSMAFLEDAFELLVDEFPSRIYLCRKPVSESALQVNYKKDLSAETRLACLERSLAISFGKMTNRLRGAMAILLFIEHGKTAGMDYIDALLKDPDLDEKERDHFLNIRRTIDIWNHGWAYEKEMATKF